MTTMKLSFPKILIAIAILTFATGCDTYNNAVSQLKGPIATIGSIYPAVSNWGYPYPYPLIVTLKPANALANISYTVDLYEQGNLRASTHITWNQPEINVNTIKSVNFPLTRMEYNTYLWKDLRHIFSIKIYK